MRARDDFASAMTDPDTDLLALDRALARAATSNRGPDPARGDAAVRDVAAALTALGGDGRHPRAGQRHVQPRLG
ncbi:MAG: hypothetical protein WKF47_11460 [Geodermatophilaceae bacterium]